MPPPSWANSATNEAPNPKPTISNGTLATPSVRRCAAVAPAAAALKPPNRVYMPSTPSRLSATTRKPETAPPRSETLMASLTLRCAAAAVRRLAWTAMYMPMKPARPEQNAPTRKATAVRIPCAGSLASPPISTPMIRAATSASSEMVRYWRFRKAIAPSKIRAATSCIAFVPVSCERTSRASHAANRTATIPASNTTGQNSIGTCVPPTFPTTYAQAAVKLSGMAADRAERGSSGSPRTVTLHTLRAEFTTWEGGRKPRWWAERLEAKDWGVAAPAVTM